MIHTFPTLQEAKDYVSENYTINGIGGGEDPFPFEILYFDTFAFLVYKNPDNTWTLLTNEV